MACSIIPVGLTYIAIWYAWERRSTSPTATQTCTHTPPKTPTRSAPQRSIQPRGHTAPNMLTYIQLCICRKRMLITTRTSREHSQDQADRQHREWPACILHGNVFALQLVPHLLLRAVSSAYKRCTSLLNSSRALHCSLIISTHLKCMYPVHMRNSAHSILGGLHVSSPHAQKCSLDPGGTVIFTTDAGMLCGMRAQRYTALIVHLSNSAAERNSATSTRIACQVLGMWCAPYTDTELMGSKHGTVPQ